MSVELSPRRGRGLLLSGLAAGLALIVGAGVVNVSLVGPGAGEWIEYPHVTGTIAHRARELEAVFTRDLSSPLSGTEKIELRCLGECSYEPPTAGATSLRVVVRRSDGPPAMALEMRDGDHVIVESDSQWLATLSGATRLPARRVSDFARPLGSDSAPAVAWLQLLALVVAAVASASAWARFEAPAGRSAAIGFAVAASWSALWWKSAGVEPGFMGFDFQHHVHYVRFILERGSLPLPSDGIQTYQPPLFYLLSALWLKVLGVSIDGPSAPLALRALTFALGIANLAGIAAALRRVLPGRSEAAQLTMVFFAAIPVHLLMMHAFANEVLLAAASTWALVALLNAMAKPQPSAIDGAAVGTLLGAALMSKLSALVLVPVVVGGLLASHPRRQGVWLSAVAVTVIVSGGYYLRIAEVYGTPFVGNWDPSVGFAWWQDPGVRSLGDYFRFGGVFGQPYYAGFESVWDGLYSTLFADGLVSGASRRLVGPAWNDGLVIAVVTLSVVPTLTLLAGLGTSFARVFERPTIRGLVLAAALVAMAAAFVVMTLRVPSYAQAKASYWSPVFAVVAVAFAVGTERILVLLRSRSGLASTAYLASLFAWAFASVAMLWIDDTAPRTLHSRAERALAGRATERALGYYAQLPKSVDEAWVDVGRCRAARLENRIRDAREACERALARDPEDAGALFHTAGLASAAGEYERALELLERMVEVAPLDRRGPPALTRVALELGAIGRAETGAREMLRFDPGSPSAVSVLGLLGNNGD